MQSSATWHSKVSGYWTSWIIRSHRAFKSFTSELPTDHNTQNNCNPNESTFHWNWLVLFFYKVPEYLCINLRISCLAAPSSSHSFANCTFNFSALLLISFPLSLRHRSIASRTSIPTASRDPAGVSPFLCKVLSPSPLLTWNSSKPAWRFSVMCAALAGWSPTSGKKILQKNGKITKVGS